MDVLERLLRHDEWPPRKLLEICAALNDEQLDREFDIGHRTLRATLNHIVHNVEAWSSLMAGEAFERQSNDSEGMLRRVAWCYHPGYAKRGGQTG